MKRIHKVLKLHQHKHTGKLLPHKHTSYRVLFALMLAPIAMIALVGQLARASDYEVTATVPALPPAGAPAILSPANNTSVSTPTVEVTGTCPVATPQVIVTISENDKLLGSGNCEANGTFSVIVSVSYGMHMFVAKVVTITGNLGESSAPVSVAIAAPGVTVLPPQAGSAPSSPGQLSGVAPIVIITPSAQFVSLDAGKNAVWRGLFSGGTIPYTVHVNWGDGETSTYKVTDGSEQMFQHTYTQHASYRIIVDATDAMGISASITSAVITMTSQSGSILDSHYPHQDPFTSFVQQYLPQIYIGTFFSLVFLWYLEHGRHLLRIPHWPKAGRHSH